MKQFEGGTFLLTSILLRMYMKKDIFVRAMISKIRGFVQIVFKTDTSRHPEGRSFQEILP